MMIQLATAADIPVLLDLMTEFYSEAGYTLDGGRAAKAFEGLIHDVRLGLVWLIRLEGQAVGHVVVTFRYGMEYGGLLGCVDDLFVKAASRNRGIANAALLAVRDHCVSLGVRAMTVEVGRENGAAHAVYRRVGFVELTDRVLLALALAEPTHIVD
jgi:GNAT superfamily N-acetyltransferase